MRRSLMVRLVGAFAVSLLLLVAIECSTAMAAEWSVPEPVDPAIYAPTVSCASESFCAAVGWTSGYGSVAVYNDRS
jgi:hypothetical protein